VPLNKIDQDLKMDNSLRKTYQTDGVIRIKGALDADALAKAEAAYKWSLANPGRGASTFAQDKPGTFYQDLANPKALTAYREMLLQTPVADIVADLWDAPNVWFMYEQVFLKEGGESRRTPWHQDASYLPVEGSQLAVMWISFEPVAKENSLEFVRGSHRGTLYDGSRFDPADDTAPLYGNGVLPRLPNIEAERDKWDIVSWAVEPGDILVFHTAMLHGGGPTHHGQRRRTLSLRFFGDDAIYTPRLPAVMSEQRSEVFPREDDSSTSTLAKLPRTLSPGDPFRHPEFLKLRPRG
jgi:ectoine hydroxylase-related dioxygenase (phytanoyl-CoA dioxygenase family)